MSQIIWHHPICFKGNNKAEKTWIIQADSGWATFNTHSSALDLNLPTFFSLWITFQNRMHVKVSLSSQMESRRELSDHGSDVVYHMGWSLGGRGKSERDFHVTSSIFWILAQCTQSEVFTPLHSYLRVIANIKTQNLYTSWIMLDKCFTQTCRDHAQVLLSLRQMGSFLLILTCTDDGTILIRGNWFEINQDRQLFQSDSCLDEFIFPKHFLHIPQRKKPWCDVVSAQSDLVGTHLYWCTSEMGETVKTTEVHNWTLQGQTESSDNNEERRQKEVKISVRYPVLWLLRSYKTSNGSSHQRILAVWDLLIAKKSTLTTHMPSYSDACLCYPTEWIKLFLHNISFPQMIGKARMVQELLNFKD